jgi:photosystem II stability/assembly factor-like uncharacterized protein
MTLQEPAILEHVYVGTAGHSAWFSEDGGHTFVHPNSHSGLYLEARVWCLARHPGEPHRVWAGTDMGLFCWDDASARWQAIDSPMHDVWAIALDPDDPCHLIAGTRPAGLYRSIDAGANWQLLEVPGLAAWSPINAGATRVTQILFEPTDPDRVWASIEIGGIFFSADRGRTWSSRSEGLVSADVHGIAVIDLPAGGQRLLATTNRGLHESLDQGLHWIFRKIDSPWQYTRAVVPRADRTGVVFLTNGNGPPGDQGRLFRSDDWGAQWREVPLPNRSNSTLWAVATDAADPMSLWLCSNLGQVWRSADGGEHWTRLPHEFGEIRALLWRPLPAGTRTQPHSITVRPPA